MNDYGFALALIVGEIFYRVDKRCRAIWYKWKYRKERNEIRRKYLK